MRPSNVLSDTVEKMGGRATHFFPATGYGLYTKRDAKQALEWTKLHRPREGWFSPGCRCWYSVPAANRHA